MECLEDHLFHLLDENKTYVHAHVYIYIHILDTLWAIPIDQVDIHMYMYLHDREIFIVAIIIVATGVLTCSARLGVFYRIYTLLERAAHKLDLGMASKKNDFLGEFGVGTLHNCG